MLDNDSSIGLGKVKKMLRGVFSAYNSTSPVYSIRPNAAQFLKWHLDAWNTVHSLSNKKKKKLAKRFDDDRINRDIV